MQDTGDQRFEKIRYCDDHDYMNFQYSMKRAFGRPMHTMYQLSVLAFLSKLHMGYVTKMVYNKDKDLVFVYKPTSPFRDTEEAYEVHHLE